MCKLATYHHPTPEVDVQFQIRAMISNADFQNNTSPVKFILHNPIPAIQWDPGPCFLKDQIQIECIKVMMKRKLNVQSRVLGR